MPAQTVEITHQIEVSAEPKAVFDLVADPAGAPRYAKSQLHAEVTDCGDGHDWVRRWVYADGQTRCWTVLRQLDADALRITFTPEDSAGDERGQWEFLGGVDGSTLLRVSHTVAVAGPEAEDEVRARYDKNVPRQLAAYKLVAEAGPAQADRYVHWEAEVPLDASETGAWQRLEAPAPWIALTERADGAEVTALTGDTERVDLTRRGEPAAQYIRIRPAGTSYLAFKRLDAPAGLAAIIGRWTVQAQGQRTLVGLAQTITLARPGTAPIRAAAQDRLKLDLDRVAAAITS